MTIRKNSGIQLPHRALSRAALTGAAAVALACLATGCSHMASSSAAGGTASSAAPAVTTASTPASSPTAAASASPDATVAAPPSVTASAQPAGSGGTGSSGAAAVLFPATVPPADKECTYPVTRGADGNVAPLLCQDGRLNVDAWNFYNMSFVGSELLRLGQGATATTVYQAMCFDITALNMTKPEAESTEKLAAAYYGWNVSASGLSVRLTTEGCPSS
jgi:hypothetical protein